MSADPVSLRAMGLRAVELACPRGGAHEVDASALVEIAKRGAGEAACVRCGGPVVLRRA